MIDLGRLKAKILLDDEDATKKLKGFSDETEKSSSRLKDFLGKTGEISKKALIGFGGAIAGVGTAMAGVTSKALETTSMIEKFSATCNVSTEEFQKLDGVFKQVGWSMENAAGDFAMLSEKMYEASTTGEGEAYEMFQKLGVAVEDSSGKLRNTGDVFNDMILSLQNVSDETERQAIASIMLGTTSEEIAPILKMTNEEFIKMKDNINVIDEEQLQKAKEFKKSWDSLKQTFETVVTELGVALMPMFQALADWVNEHMPQIQAIIESVFSVVGEVIGIIVDVISELIGWLENLMDANTETGQLIKEIWDYIKREFTTTFDSMKVLFNAFMTFCKNFWNEYGESITKVVKELWDYVKVIFETGFDFINDLMYVFSSLFQGDWEGLSEALYILIENLWFNVTELFKEALDVILSFVPMMFDIGADLFQGLWDGLKSVWTGIFNWVQDKVSWLGDKLMFWRDAKNEMNSSSQNIDGSHASGINYVPYDGYIAQLHKGERVLTSEQARNYSEFSTGRLESLLEQLNNKLDRLPRNIALETRF